MKQLLLKRKKAFAIYLLACIFPVISQILSTMVFSFLLGGIANATLDYIYKALVYGGGVVVFSVSLFVCSRFLRIRFMRDTLLDVRVMAFDKIMALDYQTFSKKSKEVYVSNLINDVNLFEQNFFLKLLNMIFLGGTYVVSIVILLFLDFKFGLATLLISVLLYYFTSKFESKTVSIQQEVSSQNEAFTVEISNTIGGMELLKLNGIENTFLDKTLHTLNKIEWKKMYYDIFTQGQRSLSMFLGTLIFVGMLIYMLFRVRLGMTLVQMTFMIQIANSCIWPLQNLVPLMNELKSSVKIFEKIAKPEEMALEIQGTQAFQFNKEIEIKHLSYAYEGRVIFKDISFKLEKGKKYLLKGASGSGKSTLMKVLSKTYTDYEGDIIVDGVSYRAIENQSFHEKVSFVYQDVFLFEDSLKNNITLYSEADEKVLNKAILKSGLDAFVSKEEGLEQKILENGKNLSGGERQRISIARALYKSSEILFADEATSSLNQELGYAVEEAILSLPCTVLAVSHRYYEGVSEQYDYVLCIENGSVKQIPAAKYFEEAYVA